MMFVVFQLNRRAIVVFRGQRERPEQQWMQCAVHYAPAFQDVPIRKLGGFLPELAFLIFTLALNLSARCRLNYENFNKFQ
jgi:hypothetical protein